MNRENGNLFQLLVDLSQYIDSCVSFNGVHSARVADLVMFVAQQMDFDSEYLRIVYWAGLLHDIGKLAVPEYVLSKQGPLSEDEWKLMRLHPTVGANIVNAIPKVAGVAPFIYSHQEKFDGSGYPEGLQGEEIPLGARILTVVDAYDAMTNDRYYRKAPGHSYALNELCEKGGNHFDPEVVNVFLGVVEEVRC
jgi:putative nucleotidyltransferase with HDIG domain